MYNMIWFKQFVDCGMLYWNNKWQAPKSGTVKQEMGIKMKCIKDSKKQ